MVTIHRLILGASLLVAGMAVGLGTAQAQTPTSYGAPMGNPNIPGYNFPEDQTTLLNWINNQPANSGQIYTHGWGIWASLTMGSGQSAFGIANAPVYMTWLSPNEIQNLGATAKLSAKAPAKRALGIGAARQLTKFGLAAQPALKFNGSAKVKKGVKATPDTSSLLVAVGYDPAATNWIVEGNLFQYSSYANLYAAGQPEIAQFPTNSVSVKPTYKRIPAGTGIYTLATWPGTPPVITPAITKGGFGESSWNDGCFYVDTSLTGPTSTTGTDPTCANQNASNTYSVYDFINIPITANNIGEFNSYDPGNGLNVGDTLLLAAMHVTSKEIPEWTWQTYFWTPNPSAPPLPSSAMLAQARPAQITGAAAHYAIVFAYQMVMPNQPENGGQSVGGPVVGYNPYLEAGFPASTFGISRPIVPASGPAWVGTVGVQTNCMTCHAMAAVGTSTANIGNSPPYATDFYIARNDPAFSGFVQADFLWSLVDNLLGVPSTKSKKN
jgi:hypothetical protein